MPEEYAPTILIADDEPEIVSVLSRRLQKAGYRTLLAANGAEALGKARVQKPSLLLLDVNMPEMDGFSVCRKLREDPGTRLIPVLMVTARGGVDDKVRGLSQGADDYIAKPFDFEELEARIQTLLRRTQHMIAVNPLSHLPGGPAIQEEVESRIRSGEKFAVAYLDIDHFKAYNDVYGYHQGDQVIAWTAKMIEGAFEKARQASGGDPAFIGHIGGDDFIAVASPDLMRATLDAIAQDFDSKRRIWYSWWHCRQGAIRTKNRQGKEERYPLMSLSIAVSTNELRRIEHFGQVSRVTAELKRFIKARPEQNCSAVVYDRRRD